MIAPLLPISRGKYGNALCIKPFVGFNCEACDEFNEYWGNNYFVSG